MSRALTLALVQLEVELLAALRALEEGDEKAAEEGARGDPRVPLFPELLAA